MTEIDRAIGHADRMPTARLRRRIAVAAVAGSLLGAGDRIGRMDLRECSLEIVRIGCVGRAIQRVAGLLQLRELGAHLRTPPAAK